jgi:hypothetical protein
MSEPFVYIGEYQIKQGKLEEARQRLRDVAELVEKHEPQLAAFHFYLDEARKRAICVQVHPGPESMSTHMAVIAQHLTTAWDWLEPEDMIAMWLGTPPDVLINYASEFDETFDAYPTHVAGFTRHTAALTRPSHLAAAPGGSS